MIVCNMVSNKGNKIPNQFIIRMDNAVYFQSYDSIIIKREKDKTYMDRGLYKYSKTTIKYRNLFLGETTKEIEKKIKDGTYILTSLDQGGIK